MWVSPEKEEDWGGFNQYKGCLPILENCYHLGQHELDDLFDEINRCTVKSSLMFSAETSLSYSDNVRVLMIHLTIQKRGMQLKYENKLQNLHSTLLQPAFESPEFSCLDLKAKVLYFEQLAITLHSQIPLC